MDTERTRLQCRDNALKGSCLVAVISSLFKLGEFLVRETRSGLVHFNTLHKFLHKRCRLKTFGKTDSVFSKLSVGSIPIFPAKLFLNKMGK